MMVFLSVVEIKIKSQLISSLLWDQLAVMLFMLKRCLN